MTSTISLFGIDEIQRLEYQSDYNLIRLYKKELSYIDKGLNFKLHKTDRKLLFHKGIIYFNHNIMRFSLTNKARVILESM